MLLGAPPALSAATAPLWLPGMAPPPAEAAAAAAAAEAIVGRGRLAPGLEVSQVVKGCWYVASVNFPSRTRASFRRSPRLTSSFIRAALCRQLSGGHRGDRKTDRTAGKAAVADFAAFEKAGITTFDTADIYGPSQELIGEFIKQRGNGSEGLQVLTKFCCFGPEMQNMTSKFVERGIDDSRWSPWGSPAAARRRRRGRRQGRRGRRGRGGGGRGRGLGLGLGAPVAAAARRPLAVGPGGVRLRRGGARARRPGRARAPARAPGHGPSVGVVRPRLRHRRPASPVLGSDGLTLYTKAAESGLSATRSAIMTVTSEEEPEKPSTGASSSTTQECAGLRKRNASATPAEMTIDPQQAPARPHTWLTALRTSVLPQQPT